MSPQRALRGAVSSLGTLLLSPPMLLLLVLVLNATLVTSELSIDSERVLRKEIGSEASFTCSDPSGKIRPEDIRWNYTEPRDANFTSRVTNANGTLVIASVVESDSGDYLCVAANGTESLRAVLKVFEMPDYVEFGLVMVSVAGALFLILVVGQAMKVVRERAKRKSPLAQKKKGGST